MITYYLFCEKREHNSPKESRKTYILPSTEFEGDGKVPVYFRELARLNNRTPADIVAWNYTQTGKITGVDPFEFITNKSLSSFNITTRHKFAEELTSRKTTIKSRLDLICFQTKSTIDQKIILDQIYGHIPIKGDLHLFEYKIFDLLNIKEVTKKRLVLQTEYDGSIPCQTRKDELDVSLGMLSTMQYGKAPHPISWSISKEPVGTLECLIDEWPSTIERVGQDFLHKLMFKDEIPF